MNLILIDKNKVYAIGDEGNVEATNGIRGFFTTLMNRQFQHCVNILKVKVGSTLHIGVKNAGKGIGIVTEIAENYLNVKLPSALHNEVTEEKSPPIDLIVALPRPKVFLRILQHAASLQIHRLIFICSERVDKGYLNSSAMKRETIEHNLQLGLEQSMFTKFPEVHIFASEKGFFKRFESFNFHHNDCFLLAHPSSNSLLASTKNLVVNGERTVLAIGPEGGWQVDEVKQFEQFGFQTVSLGTHILRCEVASIYAVAQLHTMIEKRISITAHPDHFQIHCDSNDTCIVFPQRYSRT